MRRLTLRPISGCGTDDWLWTGYLRRGEITLLAGPHQSGKATLACALLQQMAAGGRVLGRPLAPCRAWVVTPEPQFRWQLRLRNIPLGHHVQFAFETGGGHPVPGLWPEVGVKAAAARARGELDLLVLHKVHSHLSISADPEAVLAPLRPFVDTGGAVLLLQALHPAHPPAWQECLLAHADRRLVFARCPTLPWSDPLRLLTTPTPRPDTPFRVACAWHAATGRYALTADRPAEQFESQWRPVECLLRASQTPLTFAAIFESWPATAERPSRATLYRILKRAHAEGRVTEDGRGTCGDPRRWRLTEDCPHS